MDLIKWSKYAAAILVFGSLAAFGGNILRSTIGVEDIYASISAVEKSVDVTQRGLDKHVAKQEMDRLEEQMWDMRRRWGELFREEYGRPYKTIEELLAYMIDEDSKLYNRWQREYEEWEKKYNETK